MSEKIGSIFEGLAEMFPGLVRCEVTVKRRKAAAEDPAKEQLALKEPEPESAPEPATASSGGGSEESR